jgi:hypothetical protein
METDDRWTDAQRLESWAGEVRVNLIRLVALVVFYAHHLLNLYLFRDDPSLPGRFHAAVTALVVAWSAAVLGLHVCLSRRWVPPALKYVATTWDLCLLTALVAVAGSPRSPLVVLYFVVIAAAPLRLSLRLVYVATLGAIGAYVLLLGYYAFILVGSERYYGDPALRIPRAQQVIFVLALGAVGLLAGQVVRQARRLVVGYPVAVEQPRER